MRFSEITTTTVIAELIIVITNTVRTQDMPATGLSILHGSSDLMLTRVIPFFKASYRRGNQDSSNGKGFFVQDQTVASGRART